MYCKQKLSSQCEKTNANTIENAMYGGRTAGMSFPFQPTSSVFAMTYSAGDISLPLVDEIH